MSEQITAYPLQWPFGRPRAKSREHARFDRDVSFGRVRDEMYAELSRFGASSVVISSNVALRLDGIPRSGQPQPDDSGVAVYFTIKKNPHVIACDRYFKVEHNLRAIAKTIEAQRGILRWGAVTAEQIFAGFKALPNATPQFANVDEAQAWLNSLGGYTAAVRRFHPDSNGGIEPPEWLKLQAAKQLIERI